MSGQQPRIVAELGRPETPAETAARKQRNRELRRERQTNRNLIYSLLICLGVVALIVAVVPRGTHATARSVDYRAEAAQAQGTVKVPLLAPAVPAGWKANAAELRTADGVTSWYVGFVTPTNTFLAFEQGENANTTWLSDTVSGAHGSATTTVGGRPWTVYDQRNLGQSAGNVQYALASRNGTTDLVVYGTATTADTKRLAAALAVDARAKALPGAIGPADAG